MAAFDRLRMIVEGLSPSLSSAVLVQTVVPPLESLFGSFDRLEPTSSYAMVDALNRRIAAWDEASVPPRAARVAGALSLVLWVCIVLSVRMIAYNWFDCDRQPQPPIINFLTSCAPSQSEEH